MKIYVDGSGWNGKESRCCYKAIGDTPKTFVFDKEYTSNQMEYEGLIRALRICSVGTEIITDSQLLVGHLTKSWKVNSEKLKSRFIKAKQLIKEKEVKLTWVRRDKNLAGIHLEKLKDKERKLREWNKIRNKRSLPNKEKKIYLRTKSGVIELKPNQYTPFRAPTSK